MKIARSSIPEVLLIEPAVLVDDRGFFFESFNQRKWSEAHGRTEQFVQDNHSRSGRHVLRGLHYQIGRPQGKLVRCVAGVIFDVAVDLRRSSLTFGRWTGFELSGENKRMAWVPKGFAHGFLVLSDEADVLYKTTDYWVPELERTLAWDDPSVGVQWPAANQPKLSEKDRRGLHLEEAELFD